MHFWMPLGTPKCSLYAFVSHTLVRRQESLEDFVGSACLKLQLKKKMNDHFKHVVLKTIQKQLKIWGNSVS